MSEEAMLLEGYAPGEGLTGWVGQYGVTLRLGGRTDEQLGQALEALLRAELVRPLSGEGQVRPIVWADKLKENRPGDIASSPYLAVPIRIRDETIGVIRISEVRPGSPKVEFGEGDQRTLEICARHISTVVQSGMEHYASLEAIFAGMDYGVALVDPVAPDFVILNSAARRMLGIELDVVRVTAKDLDAFVDEATGRVPSQLVADFVDSEARSSRRTAIVRDRGAVAGKRLVAISLSRLKPVGSGHDRVVMVLDTPRSRMRFEARCTRSSGHSRQRVDWWTC